MAIGPRERGYYGQSDEERANEVARSTALIQRLQMRAKAAGKKPALKSGV